mgnify:FL=1
MFATDEILRSYGDTTAKTDVVGLVEIITARETWFLNNLGKSVAMNTIHSTMIDTLRTAGSSAVAEGADFTTLASVVPTLITNLVEKVAIPFKVSRTQQLVQHYHGENELARQTTKALFDWGNSTEFDLIRSTLVSGVSGTTPKMSGIIEATSRSTNQTVHSSGTALVASIINGLMRDNVDNHNGNAATDLFAGSFLRNVIDGFTQKSNSLVGVDANTIDSMVDYYQTSFGRIAVHYHRYVQQSGDATGRLLAVRPDSLKIAYLRRPFVDTTLQRAGDYDFRAVIGDMTLEVKDRGSNWFSSGFDKD